MAVVLVPLGWTLLFAVAGALTLDATSVTDGAAGIGGHIEAAFVGLITFVIAVKLPLMLLGELRHILAGASLRTNGGSAGRGRPRCPVSSEYAQRTHDCVALGLREPPPWRSAGRAAGALGTPAGGPLGAARRSLAGAARRVPGMAPAAAGVGALGGIAADGVANSRGSRSTAPRGKVRDRLSRARTVLANAPRDAKAAMVGEGSRRSTRASVRSAAARTTARDKAGVRGSNATTGKTPARVLTGNGQGRHQGGGTVPITARPRTAGGAPSQAKSLSKPQRSSSAGVPRRYARARRKPSRGHRTRDARSQAAHNATPVTHPHDPQIAHRSPAGHRPHPRPHSRRRRDQRRRLRRGKCRGGSVGRGRRSRVPEGVERSDPSHVPFAG